MANCEVFGGAVGLVSWVLNGRFCDEAVFDIGFGCFEFWVGGV